MSKRKVIGDTRGRNRPYRLRRGGARSWTVDVRIAGERTWSTNGIRFPLTKDGRRAAERAMIELVGRWYGPCAWRIAQTTDEPTHVGCLGHGCEKGAPMDGTGYCARCGAGKGDA